MGSSAHRSLMKGLVWELVISPPVLWLTIYASTGEWQLSTFASFVYTTIKVPFYYAHERAWKKIRWGKT